jgi:hypothetical protein
MAQSNATVTPDGPTPPTNFTGQIGMRPPTTGGLNPIDDGAAGTGTAFATPSAGGTAYEGAGTEVVATSSVPNPSPAGQMQTVSDLGNYTTTPNGQHASSLSPTTNPALASISPTTAVSGASGTDTITCTGTNFTRQSVVYANGVAMPTTFVSPTSITAAVRKKTSAGTWPITVVTGGVVTTASQTLTYS